MARVCPASVEFPVLPSEAVVGGMAYDSDSVSPHVLGCFDGQDDAGGEGTVRSAGDFVPEERLQALREGKAKLGWTVCNPLRDERLFLSLRLLLLHAVLVIVVLSCVTLAACSWTRHVATPVSPHRGGGTSAFETARSRAELRALMLSIDIPMFFCVGIGYALAVAVITALSRPRLAMLAALVEFVLVFVGSIVIAFEDPVRMWGSKGSIGFAGIWVVVQNTVGIGFLSTVMAWGPPEDRFIRDRRSALCFCLVLFGSASMLQGMLYLVEFFTAQGVHYIVGIGCFFVLAFLIMTFIKHCMRQWLKVPPLSITFMMYWFQAGAYLTFRLLLQAETNLAHLAIASVFAALMEVLMRLGVVLGGKLLYNHYVDTSSSNVALRVLDLHIATLIVDILAEWAALAISVVFSIAIDGDVFHNLSARVRWEVLAASIAMQAGMEIIADVVSLVVAFAVLPVTLEGILKAPGYVFMEASCIVVSLLFVYSTLNMRIRIEHFAP